MKDMFDSTTDFDYTLIMNQNEVEPKSGGNTEVSRQQAPEAPEVPDEKEVADRIYYEYEKMCLKEPTVLDKDDIYPHTYQWRAGDRYDPAKVEVVEAALRQGVRIANTEEYLKYAEAIRNRRFTPDSWD